MDTKEMAQGQEENIKRAFDVIEKCKKRTTNFVTQKERKYFERIIVKF